MVSWRTSRLETAASKVPTKSSCDYIIPIVVVLLPDSDGYTRLCQKGPLSQFVIAFTPLRFSDPDGP